MINKCFCTRRNPISISAAAIYLACQLEDKRKTQAEICKVTGLTEVTLRKVYKELLENWDDLLPSNYTPAVPPERAFPTTIIASGRSSATKVDAIEVNSSLDREKLLEIKPIKPNEVSVMVHQLRGKDDSEGKSSTRMTHTHSTLNQQSTLWQSQPTVGASSLKTTGEKNQNVLQGVDIDGIQHNHQQLEQKVEDMNCVSTFQKPNQIGSPSVSNASSIMKPFSTPPSAGRPPNV